MRTLAIILCALAFIASAAMTIYLLNIPLYRGIETVHTESGTETIHTTRTLVEVNGTRVLYLLAGVTLISGIPLLVALIWPAYQRLATWVCALLLLLFSLAGSMTIGLAYIPSAILLLIAAILTLFIRRETAR